MYKSRFSFFFTSNRLCKLGWVEAALGCWLLILLSSWQGRSLSRLLEYHGWVPLVGAGVGLVLLAAWLETWLAMPHLSKAGWVWAAYAGLIFLGLPWGLQPVERLHLALFGGLGFCLGQGLRPRDALALAALASFGDEGFQLLLPERYADLRDVALNLAAALAGWGSSQARPPRR